MGHSQIRNQVSFLNQRGGLFCSLATRLSLVMPPTAVADDGVCPLLARPSGWRGGPGTRSAGPTWALFLTFPAKGITEPQVSRWAKHPSPLPQGLVSESCFVAHFDRLPTLKQAVQSFNF